MTKNKTLLTTALIVIMGLIPVAMYRMEVVAPAQAAELVQALPGRSLSPLEQGAQALAGLIIKPVYMILSLLIILALIDQKSADLLTLQWGQIAFLAGEIFCALNFYLYRHGAILSEYLHSYGMALAFGLTSFAFLEAIDARFLRLSSSKSACAALAVCGRCTRHDREGCKARTITRFVIPILAFLTLIPLLAPLQVDAYAVSIFGFPYSYTRFDAYEIYERRVLPGLALISFLLAWIPLWRNSEHPIPFATKIFACAGIGALGFSFFRLVLNAVFAQNLVWFEFWEETTELMFVAATGFILWQFKQTLLEKTPLLESLGFPQR